MLEIEIGLEQVEYALREGDCLVIRHEAEEVRLTREQPLAVRRSLKISKSLPLGRGEGPFPERCAGPGGWAHFRSIGLWLRLEW